MFVFNVKVNGNKLFKIFFICMFIVLLTILSIVIFKIFSGSKNIGKITNKVNTIESSNYTNVLKAVHENIDNYVGVEISFTGYVYRVLDLEDNQFVLARDMIISSNYQSVIVGFLCECDSAKNYSDNTWVNITGKITKGNYHGDMPVVKITKIENVNKPNDEYVYPPDETYIPTDGIV